MLQIYMTSTEVEIILRAMDIARSTGAFPDPAIEGDALRASSLATRLRQAVEKDREDTVGGRIKRGRY